MGGEGVTSTGEYRIGRSSTGNDKLDAFLSGGYPRGSLILVSGNPGTGKTILSAEFVYDGAEREKERGIYVSFSEGRKSFFENMKTVGLDFDSLESQGTFKFLEMFSSPKESIGDRMGQVPEAAREMGASRIVIDSYSAMAQAMGNPYEARQVLHTILSKIVRNMGCTTIVVGEQPTGEERIGDAAEEFVADGVLNLKLTIPRVLEIRKMRGTKLRSKRSRRTCRPLTGS